VKYAFIKAHQELFTVRRMCALLEVSTSAYYDWIRRPESARKAEDRCLSEKIVSIHRDSRETYGARRIVHELREDGDEVSRARVGRLMKEKALKVKSRRKFKATTRSDHGRPVAPNLLERQFDVATPNTVYAGDITYIPTAEGWLYLAVMIDLHSRAVVGWAMSERMTADLVNDALMMAISKRQPASGLLVHSDRGSQYVSDLYQKSLADHGFVCSMSRKGNCWECEAYPWVQCAV